MPKYPLRVNKDATFRLKAGGLMDQVSEVLRYYHYGHRTEQAYVRWIRGFISFHTALPRICWNQAPISGWFRSCLGMPM